MALEVTTITQEEAFSDMRSQWEELECGLFPRTPFSSPVWNQLWWKHFARSGLVRRDEWFVHAVRDQSGKLQAIAPLMRTREPAFGPLRLHKVQFFGRDPSITELRGIVCNHEQQGEVIDALLDHFESTNANWDFIEWSGIRSDVKIASSKLCAYQDLQTRRILPDYLISLPPTWEELLSRLSSNTRKTLRKGHEFLRQDGHDFELRVTEPTSDFREAVDQFFVLHRARSEAQQMKTHRDSFAEERHRLFLDDLAQQMGPRGLLCIVQLVVGSKIVASRICFTLDKQLYFYFSGYDPSFRKYGIMTILVIELIKWAIQRDFKFINLSTGKDLSKLRWKPEEIEFKDMIHSSSSLIGKLAVKLSTRMRRIRQ